MANAIYAGGNVTNVCHSQTQIKHTIWPKLSCKC